MIFAQLKNNTNNLNHKWGICRIDQNKIITTNLGMRFWVYNAEHRLSTFKLEFIL